LIAEYLNRQDARWRRVVATILLVEDQPNQQLLYQLVLEDDGYCVERADGIDVAIQILNETMIDLVVLDLGLSDRRALDLLRFIRIHYPHMQVVAFTGSARSDFLPDKWVRYLMKSSNIDALRREVKRGLAQSNTQEITQGGNIDD